MEAPRLEYVGDTPIVIDPLGHHYIGSSSPPDGDPERIVVVYE